MSKPFNVTTMTHEELGYMMNRVPTYNQTLIDENVIRRRVPREAFPGLAITRSTIRWSDPLSKLPTEMLHLILGLVDVESIFKLRRTSPWLRLVINTWAPFQAIMADGEGVVRAMLATQASWLWTTLDVQAAVYAPECELCHQHGDVLHLLKMKRVCFRCVTTDRRLLAVDWGYATRVMGLTHDELRALAQIRTIRQPIFWGLPSQCGIAVDYSAASELATTKFLVRDQTSSPPQLERYTTRSILKADWKRCGKSALHETQTDVPHALPESIYKRRQQQHLVGMGMPHFLLEPPEAVYIQHAACVRLPVLKLRSGKGYRQQAVLCAGCAFYWNYHSPLPSHCHNQFLHEPSHKESSRHLTSFESHLMTCIYAKVWWDRLYPAALNHLNPANQLLIANGGPFTAKQIAERQSEHTTVLLLGSGRGIIHQRHPEFAVALQINPVNFELLPSLLLEELDGNRISCQTTLEIELEQKLQDGHETICNALSSQDDQYLSALERAQILRVKRDEEENDVGAELLRDTYGDLLLGHSMETASQAGWATARAGSSTALFRGWYTLLMLRRAKEEALWSKGRTGKERERILARMPQWGFAQFSETG